MAATKKYYYEDLLLGSSTTSLVGNKKKAYCTMDTAIVGLDNLLNELNGCVITDVTVLDDYQLVPCDKLTGAMNAITAVTVLSGTTTTRMSNTHLMEGDVVRILFRIRNPFKYAIQQRATYLYTGYTSIVESYRVQLLSTTYGCNANTETSIRTGNTFTIGAPEKFSNERIDTMWFGLNILENDPQGELQCSGCTDIGKHLPMNSVLYNNASATTYGTDAALLSKPVLALPYVKIGRQSGSGNVNSGATVTMYVRIYNPNKYNLTAAYLRIDLSGTGFSDSVGQISWNSSNSYSNVLYKSSITAGTTTDANYQTNDTYKTYNFYYKAPSSTTQGTAIMTGTITGSTIDGRTGIKGPSRGDGQIVVNATAPANPQYYYYPFRLYDINGDQVTSSTISWNIGTLTDSIGGTTCVCWDDGGGWCGGSCQGTFTFGSVLNGSSDRVYYARVATSVTTFYFDYIVLTEFYDGGAYEASSGQIYRTSGSTYAAFNAAGITRLDYYDTAIAEMCESEVALYNNNGYISVRPGLVLWENTPSYMIVHFTRDQGAETRDIVFDYGGDTDDNWYEGAGAQMPISALTSGNSWELANAEVFDSGDNRIKYYSIDPKLGNGTIGIDTELLSNDYYSESVGAVRWIQYVPWTECVEGDVVAVDG